MIKPTEENLVASAFHILGHEIFMNAVRHGFYPMVEVDDGDKRIDLDKINKGERIALMHSELSEALKGIRKSGNHEYIEADIDTCKCGDRKLSSSHIKMDEHCPDFTSEEVELADCVIRILDHNEAFKLRLCEAMIAKMKYNELRPYKHGKAF